MMYFKYPRILLLAIGILFTITIYFRHSRALPLFLLPLFIFMKLSESTDSKWVKGISYLGLGVVGLFEIASNKANEIGASFYAVTMSFIEFFDLCFDSELAVSVWEKLNGLYQRIKIEFVGPCLELKTIGAPDNKNNN